ncbi:hypothetical protein FSARC_2846 [Fusarium sarcochroum]|uniref:Nucleoside-diphosphate-sugar epimerase n=1 Tax=Fusarium sarcochroum TaxID=1208366 RepID=A0A8H4U5R1_9HYPO|nr:hypothetical protein FSARC_2846 [Fusarium sarcochroum]
MHLILTGATGLVGSGVLDAMLKSKQVTKISILSRRPVPLAANNPKVNIIIHKDFTKYEPEVLDKLRGAKGVVWALGISQTKVTKEGYVAITKDFPLAAANAFTQFSSASEEEPFRFIYVSAAGANTNPGYFTPFFGRVKGEVELELADLGTPRFHAESVRPAGVDPSNHAEIKPFIPDPGLAYKVMGSVLLPLMRTVLSSAHSPTEPLGSFLTKLAMGDYDQQLDASDAGITIVKEGQSRILENSAFRHLYGL